MDNHMKILMVKDLCKTILVLVRFEIENQKERATSKRYGDIPRANDIDDLAARIINISKVIMEFLDNKSALNLNPKELDNIVHGCLFTVYRMPSIANEFEADTVAFFNWWKKRIKGWIKGPTSFNGGYRQLGWRHLTEMIRETRDHLQQTPPRSFIARPPSPSFALKGARSKFVKREYRCNNRCKDRQGEHQYSRYYSAQRTTYEKIMPTVGSKRTLIFRLCDANRSPTRPSFTQKQGGRHWFLTELGVQASNADDCDIDYYRALPRSGKRKRASPNRFASPLLQEFPAPTVVPVVLETHGHRLARWILEEDILSTGWSKHPQDDSIDAGIASSLELLADLFEGDNSECDGSGTQSLVKFSVVCLEGSQQMGIRSYRGDGDTRAAKRAKWAKSYQTTARKNKPQTATRRPPTNFEI